jgi:site-specific DNA recombinase
MKAAIYARYSTDKQREASIEDQYRNCERHAEREGWTITKRYEDRGVSGSKNDRPGYQQMLADAKAKAFDVVIVDDLSRLSRDDVETKQAIRRLKFWGLRVVGVSDGFDTGSKGYKIQAGVRGLMNEIYLDDLREKTHRGLTGQALKGNNCGGRAYGYKHVPIEDGTKRDQYDRPLVIAVRREVDPAQAKWVKWMFERFADGHSPRWIAAELNKRKVPSPRSGKWLQSAIYGHARKGTGLLNQELYRGRYVWNRSEWVKHPDTGKRHRIERPEPEWIVQEMPELRIVPEKLWQRVKARQLEQHQASEAIRKALHERARFSPAPGYLFSSLLKCGVCGANYVIRNQRDYGCGSFANGGKHACGNKLRVSRDIVESRLLEAIKGKLLTPEAEQRFVRSASRRLTDRRSSRELKAARQRLEEVEREIANIMTAIKAGILTPTTKAELEAAEAERERLRSQTNPRNENKVAELLPQATAKLRQMVEGLEKTADRDIAFVRSRLKILLRGGAVLHPTEKGYLEAELTGDYAGLLRLVSGNTVNYGENRSGSGGRI